MHVQQQSQGAPAKCGLAKPAATREPLAANTHVPQSPGSLKYKPWIVKWTFWPLLMCPQVILYQPESPMHLLLGLLVFYDRQAYPSYSEFTVHTIPFRDHRSL